ncbi:putative TrbC/VIRB2 family protein [Candidatus Hepatincolaceae symbiont of Richtersius coronifer]
MSIFTKSNFIYTLQFSILFLEFFHIFEFTNWLYAAHPLDKVKIEVNSAKDQIKLVVQGLGVIGLIVLAAAMYFGRIDKEKLIGFLFLVIVVAMAESIINFIFSWGN